MKALSIIISTTYLIFLSINLQSQTVNKIKKVVFEGDSVVLRLANYSGEIQWQKSTDSISWTNIQSSDGEELLFLADQTSYFRIVNKKYPDSIVSNLGIVKVYPKNVNLSDVDGNRYRTVQIGSQIWMAENLRTTRYADGKSIEQIKENSIFAYYVDSNNNPKPAFCWYNNDSIGYARYGAMYNWAAAMNGATSSDAVPSGVQGVCPTGWHLPSDAEWKILEKELGMSADVLDQEGWRGTSQGSKLAGEADLWANDKLTMNFFISFSDFNGLPCGDRSWDEGIFYGFGLYGNWWTSLQGNATNAYNRYISFNQTGIRRSYAYKHNGNSIRCLKD